MKPMMRIFEIVVCSLSILLAFGGCKTAESETIDRVPQDQPVARQTPEGTATVFTDGSVAIENVTFNFDRDLIERVEFSEKRALKLEEEDQHPGAVGARTLLFDLKYRDAELWGYVLVFKLAEYKEAFALFPRYLEKRDESLHSLINKPSTVKSWGTEQPVHVRWMDAHHDFYAKSRIVPFNGGQGLLMLTQISQDDYIINNERLEYYVQGITGDGVYFVEMSFPADMQGLPEDGSIDAARRYGLPKDFYYEERHQKVFQAYRRRVAKQIDSTSDSEFEPLPAKIREFISSFTVQ
ncbi:hypothetical protein BH24ACI3_BH24ACI3_16940 [soil metagenome]